MRLAYWLLFFPLFSIAQPPLPVEKALSIGDTVPAAVMRNALSSPTSSLSTKGLHDKAVIIDFWATWCTNCMASIKKLDSLQKQFDNQLEVILVTSQPASTVQPFISKNKILSKLTMPVITSDSLLNRLFPHGTIPHTIWIDKPGKVKAITSSNAITAKNLSDLVGGKQLNLPVKKELLDYDPDQPLLVNGNGGEWSFLFNSSLSGYLPGLGKRAYSRAVEGGKKITYINHSILELYQTAMSTSYDNRLVLEVADPSGLIKPLDDTEEWEKDHSYSYELFVPLNWSKQQMHSKMVEDMNRYFGLAIRKEKRKIDCYVITRKNNVSQLHTRSEKPYRGKSEDGIFRMRNIPIAVLMKELNRMQPWEPHRKPVILNETGYSGNIDINISASIYPVINIEQLGKDLDAAGLSIRPAQREVDVFVLSESNTK